MSRKRFVLLSGLGLVASGPVKTVRHNRNCNMQTWDYCSLPQGWSSVQGDVLAGADTGIQDGTGSASPSSYDISVGRGGVDMSTAQFWDSDQGGGSTSSSDILSKGSADWDTPWRSSADWDILSKGSADWDTLWRSSADWNTPWRSSADWDTLWRSSADWDTLFRGSADWDTLLIVQQTGTHSAVVRKTGTHSAGVQRTGTRS